MQIRYLKDLFEPCVSAPELVTTGSMFTLYFYVFQICIFHSFLFTVVSDFLLYALRTSIHRRTIRGDQSDISFQIDGIRNAIAVDYDYKNHILFWADITTDRIQRLSLNGCMFLLLVCNV